MKSNRSPEYQMYIHSEKWKIKRNRYIALNGSICKACGKKGQVVIHHLSYENFGAEPMVDLVSLCNPCHVEVHAQHRRMGRPNMRALTKSFISKKNQSKNKHRR